MELSSKLRRLEELLKPSRALELKTESHVRVGDVPRVSGDIYIILGALLEMNWSLPSLSMPMKDGLFLQWDFGPAGYFTLVCETKTPAADFVRLQSGLVHEPSP